MRKWDLTKKGQTVEKAYETEKNAGSYNEIFKKYRDPAVLSPVKLTLIKTKTQFFLSDQIVVIFRHGLVISFSGNELIREVHYSSTNLFL